VSTNPDIILPIITLMAGTLLGFFSQLFFKSLEIKQSVSDKVLDQFFNIRSELCAELSKLAILQESKALDPTLAPTSRNRISELYFTYYDFLPKEILEQLNCLFACLSDRENRIFVCKNGKVIPIQPSELHAFIESISLIENFKYSAPIHLQSKDENTRRITSIKCQARSVLKSLNEYFTMQNLTYWIKHVAK